MGENHAVPVHVAIIMDGNGRWASQRSLPRTAGHREGVKTVKRITQAAADYGIKYLTLYAFSTENWKRSKEEVNFLFHLFVDAINGYLAELKQNGVRLNFIGDFKPLPYFLKKAMDYAKRETKNGERMMLDIAINYGGRREIVQAVKKICSSGVNIDDINEETFENFLYTRNIPDPDLIIRTSGEERLSNFLLYQSSYSELFFTKTLWPDFSSDEFLSILKKFSERKRRFGKA
jgi:undecaprenyl diphosphate synthase